MNRLAWGLLSLGAAASAAACSQDAGTPTTRRPARAPVDSAALPRTRILAHPAEALRPEDAGKNLAWCATFRMAWDALKRDVAKGPVTAGGADPPTTRSSPLSLPLFGMSLKRTQM